MGACDEFISHTTSLTVPKPHEGWMRILLGILNLFFFGVGTIIAGCLVNDVAHMLIGVCQLLIPFVGWIWSIVWGSKYIMSRFVAMVLSCASLGISPPPFFGVSAPFLFPLCSPHDHQQVDGISL